MFAEFLPKLFCSPVSLLRLMPPPPRKSGILLASPKALFGELDPLQWVTNQVNLITGLIKTPTALSSDKTGYGNTLTAHCYTGDVNALQPVCPAGILKKSISTKPHFIWK